MHPVSRAELAGLARGHGALVVRTYAIADALERPEASRTGVAPRLPDDGTGPLPLLRHVILDNAEKSRSTRTGVRGKTSGAGRLVVRSSARVS